jgi:DNA-binding MarR family transcriptional regulator
LISSLAGATILLKRTLNVKEKLNMTMNLESANLILRLWFLLHRDYALLRGCEDQIYGEKGLTMEQYATLVAIKYLDNPVRPTDVARWIGRSPNSVSMIIDRMVKAGLVRRERDRRDRRVVRLIISSKAENALKPATQAGWEFIQKIMSPLSDEDRHTLARLLETLRYQTMAYLNPGEDIQEMVINDDKSHINLRGRLVKRGLTSTAQAKRRGGEKGRTI